MFRCMTRLAILAVVGAVGLWFVGAYRVVQTKNGVHLIRKSHWSFDQSYVDTRNWDLLDYVKNAELTQELGKIRLEEWRSAFKDYWTDLQSEVESYVQGLNEKDQGEFRRQFRDLQTEVQRKIDSLQEKWDKKELDTESYQRQMEQLEKWARKEFEKVRDHFRDTKN